MTATEFMPVAINTSQSIVTALYNAEVFDDISLMQVYIGIFALSIICELIIWVRTRGYGNE